MSKKSLNDDTLKTIVVLVVTTAWAIAVIAGIIDPTRQVNGTVTSMMGAIVGYFFVDKYVSGGGKNDKNS